VTPPSGGEPAEAFAIVAPGLAPLAAAELAALGVPPREVEPAGVAFAGDAASLLRVNLHARLVSRVVLRLATFGARDFATLEREAGRVPWARVLRAGEVATLSVTCRKSRLYHSDAVAERVARAIAARLPSVQAVRAGGEDEEDGPVDAAAGPAARRQLLLVRFERDVCTISADASGARLHQRGWRLATAKAPLRETLAAALLAASGWPGDVPLVDPLGGAGTIAIEAALRARCLAPGLARAFACEQWPGADPALARALRDEARAQARPAAAAPIVCADRDAGAVAAARANAERAGVSHDVQVLHQPLSATDLSALGPRGWVVTNPPWGIRTGDPETLRALWGRLGAIVRAGGTGWTLAAVVPDPALARELRLPLDRLLTTTAGGRPVTFVRSHLPIGSA
jgi:putative N6-adenine-specific DNA methylase